MTLAALKTYSHKDLAQMAKQGGVRGWHSMRKEQLMRALLSAAKARSAPINGKKHAAPASSSSHTKVNGVAPAHKASNARAQRHITMVKAKLERTKNVASDFQKGNGQVKERMVVMVRDAFWLHAYWEVKRTSVERVQAAMHQEWHTARPYLH